MTGKIRTVNPYEFDIVTGASKTTNRALVVSIDDPEKQARIKYRLVAHLENQQGAPDETLPWGKVAQGTNSGGLQGTGSMHGLLPGTMVTLERYGSDDFIITGVEINDTKQNEDNQALPPITQGHMESDVRPKVGKLSKKLKGNDGTFGFLQPLGELYKTKTTEEARRHRDQTRRKPKQTEETWDQAVNKIPNPDRYGSRSRSKDPKGGTIGGVKFNETQNVQQFIQNAVQNKSAILPNALSAIENLKNVAGNPTAINSIGAGNYSSLLSQISSWFGGGSQGDAKQKEKNKKFDCEYLLSVAEDILSKELKEARRICELIEQQTNTDTEFPQQAEDERTGEV